MSTLRQVLKFALTAALPPAWFLVHGPRRLAASAPTEIALTFDDGPHPEHTPRILDLLAAADLKGTFFVVGKQAQRHPDLIRRIAAAGHELGNHSWTHGEPAGTPTDTFLNETRQTRHLLQDLTGCDCHLTRPPKGRLTLGKAVGLWRQQQTIVLWNIDPKDFSMTDSREMLRWFDGYRPRHGDIVLLHDDRPHAAACLERLSALTEQRPKCVAVSEWLTRRQTVLKTSAEGSRKSSSEFSAANRS